MALTPFHLSVPVTNLADKRRFYGEVLGCEEGRSAESRIDWNFFGHHLVTHVEPGDASHVTTDVDSFGVMTPCRHFGVVISYEEWARIADRVRALQARFHTEPQTVFPGTVKEQNIMLIHDGCGNIVEFKASRHGLWQRNL